MNIRIYISIFRETVTRSSGLWLTRRVPQPKPLPDVVHRTTNGVVMEGAVAMELGARYFVCREMNGKWEKSPPK